MLVSAHNGHKWGGKKCALSKERASFAADAVLDSSINSNKTDSYKQITDGVLVLSNQISNYKCLIKEIRLLWEHLIDQ